MVGIFLMRFFLAQGDAAGGDCGQGGAGETTATAGRGKNCYQGNNIRSLVISGILFYLR